MKVEITRCEGGYRAVAPDVPDCAAIGASPEEAAAAVRVARADRIRSLREARDRGAGTITLTSSNPDGDVPEARLDLDPERLAEFCARWRITRLWLFGSVLRDDWGPASDVDVLVEFGPGRAWSLLALGDMAEELESWFGRPVDLVPEPAVTNPIRRRYIERHRKLLYASGD